MKAGGDGADEKKRILQFHEGPRGWSTRQSSDLTEDRSWMRASGLPNRAYRTPFLGKAERALFWSCDPPFLRIDHRTFPSSAALVPRRRYLN